MIKQHCEYYDFYIVFIWLLHFRKAEPLDWFTNKILIASLVLFSVINRDIKMS